VAVDQDESLEILFRQHYGRLVRALTLVAGDREHAADAVQEAFVKAHLNWWRLRHYEDPIGWVRRVAINRLHDVRRRRGREDRAMTRLAAGSAEGEEASTGAATDAGHSGLAAALGDLPRQQRLAVTLYYVAELSVAEVAAAMRINEGTVKFHLHQGRERLRAVIGADGEGLRRDP
jgi:RNA polymerase sigma-70 factor (ECF subfamily)